MEQEFKEFISKHSLITSGDFILCAVSGGMDSICMAELLRTADINIGIAHLNHSMRGSSSDMDEELCRKYAEQHHLPFHVKKLIPGIITKNFQAEAREIRYQWLEELSETYGYTKIATAHHRDDQIENFFLKVTRNSGLEGLSGIKVLSNSIIRPLLFATKSDIFNYVSKNRIAYREDESNLSNKYDRNYIRNEVLPKITYRFPEFPDQLHSAMDKIQEANQLLQFFMGRLTAKIFQKDANGYCLSLEKIKDFPSPEYVLFELLKHYGFNRTQVENIYGSVTGGEIISPTARVLKDRNQLIIRNLEKKKLQPIILKDYDQEYNISEGRGIIIESGEHISKNQEKSILVPEDRIKLPLTVRLRKPGDEFYPKGMEMKKKKLKKFLTDLKLNKYKKDEVLLLTNADDEIIWVIDYRQDERFTCKASDPDQLLIRLTEQ